MISNQCRDCEEPNKPNVITRTILVTNCIKAAREAGRDKQSRVCTYNITKRSYNHKNTVIKNEQSAGNLTVTESWKKKSKKQANNSVSYRVHNNLIIIKIIMIKIKIKMIINIIKIIIIIIIIGSPAIVQYSSPPPLLSAIFFCKDQR